jgi:hypothetical protein
MTKARMLGLGFGIVLILAAFAIVVWQGVHVTGNNVAFAQAGATATPSASPTTAPSTSPSTAPSQQPSAQQQAIGDTFWSILAGKLGVNADDLKSKALDARKEMLDQAVKDGRITQAQADALKGKLTSNNLIAPIPLPRNGQGNGQPQNPQGQPRRGPFFGFRGNGNPGPFFGNRFPGGFGFGSLGGAGLQDLQAVAKSLNLDPKALITQLSQGKTLADVAKAQNVDQAVVKQAIIDARKANIDQLLSYGLISEAQANQLKAQLTPDKIDLTRPLFWFRGVSGQQSELAPGFEMGEVFGGPFGAFGMDGSGSDQNQIVPPANIQTQ